MKKKKTIITVSIIIILILLAATIVLTYKNNLVELNYNEIMEKIENKEDFVLCVSASDCIHCQSYKPKLKKIANNHDIIIYYTDVDKLSKEEYESFKSKLSFDGSTPTTVFFKAGEEKTTASRINGDAKTEKILNKLKQNGFITE